MLPTITSDKIDLPPGTITSFTRIEDYIPLAIPEVWIYQKNELKIYQFANDSYFATNTSNIFPNFPVKQTIPQYVERAWLVGSSVALKEFIQLLS